MASRQWRCKKTSGMKKNCFPIVVRSTQTAFLDFVKLPVETALFVPCSLFVADPITLHNLNLAIV
jgi:hypothetical protein